jgi:hypothetical protein
MFRIVLASVLVLVVTASCFAALPSKWQVREDILWQAYRTPHLTVKKQEIRKKALKQRGVSRRDAEPTDAELEAAAGIQLVGSVSNPTQSAFLLELNSFAAWVHKSDQLKVGLALGAEYLSWGPQDQLKLTLDVADDLVGGSLNLILVPVVRLAVGVGYARLISWHENTWYFKGSVRLW